MGNVEEAVLYGPCTKCQASAGDPCRAPSGRTAKVHADRPLLGALETAKASLEAARRERAQAVAEAEARKRERAARAQLRKNRTHRYHSLGIEKIEGQIINPAKNKVRRERKLVLQAQRGFGGNRR